MKATEHGPDLASLQELVDSVPSLIHTARPDGFIDFFNHRWLEFVGLQSEDLEGWKWTAAIHPDDVAALVAKWRACLASGEPFEFESRVRRADGAYRWMWHQKLPLRNASGEIVKWCGSSVDIDDRKQAEFYLAEGQRLGHTGSWAFNADGFDYWSSELRAIHGLAPGGQAPTIAEYLALVHPDDREFVAQTIQRMLSDHRGFDFTKRIVRPDGGVRYVRCVGAPAIESEGPRTIVGTTIDVTEHELLTRENRRREAYLAEAQRLSHTGSFGWNVSTDEHFWSDETFRIFEFDPSSKVSLPMIVACVHPQDMPAVNEAIAVATRAEGIDLEIRLLMPDGRIKHLHVVARGERGETGGVEVIGAVMDVTARKLTEVELRRSKAHLTDAQRLSHVGSVGMEASTRRIFWSEESARIYGYAPGTEPTPDLILQRVHPEDVGLVQGAIERAGRGGDDFDYEHRLLMPDGSIKHVYNLAHCYRDEAGNAEVVGAIMDVTERRVAEAAIRRSEAYLADAQRLSHTGSFGWRPDSGEIVWSAETFRIFGYDEGMKPTLDSVVQRVHPEDRAEFQRVVNTASGSAASQFEHSYRLLLPGGRVTHVHALARRIAEAFDSHEFVGAVTDITAHKRAEESVRESEAYLAEAQRLSQTGSWAWSAATGGPSYWSEECYRVLGFDPTDGLPQGEDFFQRIHPDDRPGFRELVETSVREMAEFEADYRVVHPDGRVRDIHVIAHPVLSTSGELVEFVGTVIDVTERKRAEEELRRSEMELRQILDLSSQLVGVLGPARERLYLNHTGLEYLGVGLDEWRQRAPGVSIHPEDVGRLYAQADRASSTSMADEVEVRVRKHDGSYRWFQVRLNPIRDDQGQITRWYWACTDIEDRKRAQERLEQENVALREEIDKTSMFEEIVGASPALEAVLKRVARVARTDSTVLISGETGTGKELVARAIHRRSARGGRGFITLNCAAVPRELIASELFGHEKGAFTGATQRRLGRFELAHGGTIFLDEIGELPMETQVALLRVLQEREFERVGASTAIRVDVRVIAATNRDLQSAIEMGTFRSDLFYRLNVFPLTVPPLRERADDIPLLVEYFIDRYARKAGKTIRRVNKRTLERLQSYPWPGNVRELQNVIERSVIVGDTDEFTVDDSWLAGGRAVEGRFALASTVAAHERTTIEEALRASGGRVFGPSGAAARLGIARSTLESKIRALEINKNHFRGRPAKS